MSTLLATTTAVIARWISRKQVSVWGPVGASAFLRTPPLADRSRTKITALLYSTNTDSVQVDPNETETSDRSSNSGTTAATALIFDTETTGIVRFRDPYTNPSQPDLVQLGFLMVDTSDWRIRNQGSFLVQLRDPLAGIEEGAKRVHGISEADCSEFGIERETALDLFENLCGRADVLVGHNIKFDSIVMQSAFYRCEKSTVSELLSSKRQICTMLESIDLCKLPSKYLKNNSTTYKWPSLQEAYNFVTDGNNEGKTLEGAHDALVDSEACLKIFRYLVEHGHVSLENKRAESPDKSASNLTTTVSPGDSSVGASSATEPSTNDDVDSIQEGVYNADAPERNGGIDRSREIEESGVVNENYSAERNGGIDRSREVEAAASYDNNTSERNENTEESNQPNDVKGAKPRPFDPASFSPDILENDTVDKNSTSAGTAGEGFRVSGNTYKHKEMIKQLGGQWHSQSKEWVFRESRYLSKLESIEDLTIEPWTP